MARYPTFEEYEKTGKYKDGIKRADDFLKKSPHDVQLLTVKLQLLAADGQETKPVLDQLLAIQPPIQNLGELYTINNAIVQSQRNSWPRPSTVGPEGAKLWDNAVKATTNMNHKLELLIQRFESSVEANYTVDAHQALIQLKALQPKNRAIYMAHAAVTQLISTSKEDMQSRLALMLAKKAAADKFDEDADLDCRVPGQILAVQGAMKDLDGVRGRRFAESKQVYEALRDAGKGETNGAVASGGAKDITKATPTDKLMAEISGLKPRFAQLVDSSSDSGKMLVFAAEAMRVFLTSTQTVTNVRPRTKGEACFVAISALVKAFQLSEKLNCLLISAHLAEILLKLDEQIHEARLILVYLYMRLGLGSLAVHYFDSLSIKEVQFDTVGHALFTDLSYIHPHQLSVGKKDERNPISRAKTAVQVYKRCEEKLAETEASVLSNGQTGMIFDLHELRDSLRSSTTKRMIFLEIRRQARLLLRDSSWHTQDLGPKCVANWIETKDNRDFAATFNYGCNVERVLQSRGGALPGKQWILRGLATDVAWCLANGKEADSPIEDPEALVKELENDPADLSQLQINDSDTSRSAAKDSDRLAADVACNMLQLLLLVRNKPAVDELKTRIENVERSIDRLNIGALCEADDTFSERLREHYLYLDVLKIAERACDFATKTEAGCKDDLTKLRLRCTDDVARLRSHAEKQSKSINAAKIQAEMAKEGEVFEALGAFGQDGIEAFCEAVATSAKDGWAGLGKLKV